MAQEDQQTSERLLISPVGSKIPNCLVYIDALCLWSRDQAFQISSGEFAVWVLRIGSGLPKARESPHV